MTSVGLYCGTFNPFHKGHLNIYQKACKIFEQVVVCQGINPEKGKANQLYIIPGVAHIERYEGLTTSLIQQYALRHNVTLIRGLRNGYDYDYEMNQIQVMRDIYPALQVVLIPCDKEYAHISSTMIRNLEAFDWEQAQTYLPK